MRWGETRDFRDALGIVGHIDMAAANAMLGGSRQIAQEDVPRDFERYTARRQMMVTAELLDREACEHERREVIQTRDLSGEVQVVNVCKDCGKILGRVE